MLYPLTAESLGYNATVQPLPSPLHRPASFFKEPNRFLTQRLIQFRPLLLIHPSRSSLFHQVLFTTNRFIKVACRLRWATQHRPPPVLPLRQQHPLPPPLSVSIPLEKALNTTALYIVAMVHLGYYRLISSFVSIKCLMRSKWWCKNNFNISEICVALWGRSVYLSASVSE
ncbi:unnamed protein product [Lactuca virosa]|uniref:Uncharacterized protein n=1 Tax=Lactuca virosa TaxID=75947 RepID=A0AAU9LNA8_9ASTR|nr:unnamed protein product [Lactuca virosa]